jgi:hypothetical protein
VSDGQLDELLRPSVETRPREGAQARRPWRLGSQVYVAFFGGALAAAAIAFVNAQPLGVPAARRWGILALGALGLVASVAVAAAIGTDGDSSSSARVGARVAALVAWGGMYFLQRTADRVWSYHAAEEEPYAPLWVPGLLTVIPGAVVQAALIAAATGGVA